MAAGLKITSLPQSRSSEYFLNPVVRPTVSQQHGRQNNIPRMTSLFRRNEFGGLPIWHRDKHPQFADQLVTQSRLR
jgi:hypothetical protein